MVEPSRGRWIGRPITRAQALGFCFAVVLILALMALTATADNERQQVDREPDCQDFASQADAQRVYEESGEDDPYGLDRDRDGVACESLP